MDSVYFSRKHLAGNIRIDCVYELSFTAHIRIFTDQFQERYPDVQITFDVLTEGTPETYLSALPYDILFTPCDYPQLPDHVKGSLVRSHGVYAVVWGGHGLLSHGLVRVSELAGETIIVPRAEDLFGPYMKNFLLSHKLTHETVKSLPVPNVPTALFQVQRRQGIALMPRYVKSILPPDIFMIGVSTEGCQYNEYIYLTGKDNPMAAAFYDEYCAIYLRRGMLSH